MVATFPSDVRAFWAAHLGEIMERIFNRRWLNASYRASIDYLMKYTFGPHDPDGWAGRVLIIEADDDQIIGPDQLAALKRAYPAPVVTFHGAGHAPAPALTRETEYVKVLRTFLNPGEKGSDSPPTVPHRSHIRVTVTSTRQNHYKTVIFKKVRPRSHPTPEPHPLVGMQPLLGS